MQTVYLSYLNLTPGLENQFSNESHKTIIKNLRECYSSWQSFSSIYPQYNIGFIIVTKKNVEKITIKGPTIDKRSKVVDYSIFLPDRNYNLSEYIDLLFEGIFLSLSSFYIKKDDIVIIRERCKKELLN
jgi:hypothetical protein